MSPTSDSPETARQARPVRAEVLRMLRAKARQARFVSEIQRSVQLAGGSPEEFEKALAELENEGVIIIHPQTTSDPHLEGADLRIAAMVDRTSTETDPYERALRDLDSVWGQWLTQYLSNHRCT